MKPIKEQVLKDPLDEIFVENHIKNDYSDLSKEDLIENIKNAVSNISRLEKENKLLNATEKERLRLLNENLELKSKLGVLYLIKNLLDNVKCYYYNDLINLQTQRAEFLEFLKDLLIKKHLLDLDVRTKIYHKIKELEKWKKNITLIN